MWNNEGIRKEKNRREALYTIYTQIYIIYTYRVILYVYTTINNKYSGFYIFNENGKTAREII